MSTLRQKTGMSIVSGFFNLKFTRSIFTTSIETSYVEQTSHCASIHFFIKFILVPEKFQLKPCARRTYEEDAPDSFVCVCNATYCDNIAPLPVIADGEIVSYTTTKAGLRFQQDVQMFGEITSNSGFHNIYAFMEKVYITKRNEPLGC